MAEEQKNPEEENTVEEAVEEIEETVEATVEETAEAVEEIAEEVEETVETAIEAVETDVDAEAQPTAIEAADEVVEADGHAHHYSDEVVLPYFGHVGTMPGGIYTFVFLILGVLTAIEVGLTFIGENAFIITILVILSLTKAVLVMMYYMHLKDDNPLYRLVVILPLLIVLLSTLYLLFVPTGAGLGYS